MAPVGSVPAASPSTYIDSGTVASDISGASVAPTIEPVAKTTAEFAPVRACAAASRARLERVRASSEISSAAVRSIIRYSSHAVSSASRNRQTLGHYEAGLARDQLMQTGRRYASRLCLWPLKHQNEIVGGHFDDFDEAET